MGQNKKQFPNRTGNTNPLHVGTYKTRFRGHLFLNGPSSLASKKTFFGKLRDSKNGRSSPCLLAVNLRLLAPTSPNITSELLFQSESPLRRVILQDSSFFPTKIWAVTTCADFQKKFGKFAALRQKKCFFCSRGIAAHPSALCVGTFHAEKFWGHLFLNGPSSLVPKTFLGK